MNALIPAVLGLNPDLLHAHCPLSSLPSRPPFTHTYPDSPPASSSLKNPISLYLSTLALKKMTSGAPPPHRVEGLSEMAQVRQFCTQSSPTVGSSKSKEAQEI